jgi:Zn-finger nucleic acid-binding protein
MKCPIDQNLLTISSREGIEIDYCPSCRGVWLDRGELDKLIERSESSNQQRTETNSDRRHHSAPKNDHDSYENRDYHKKKKSSILGDLFDF